MKINHITNKGSQITTNYHSAKAFKMTPKTELIQRVITCYWNEPKFYEQGEVTATAIIELIQKVAKTDPEFVLQLAKTIREPPYNMRTVSTVMWVEAGLNENIKQLRDDEGKSLIVKYAPSILKRADELTEALAYVIQQVGEIGSNGDGSIPAGIKKGIAKAFDNFDEYQFTKYRGTGDVKLKDVIKLVRPKPRKITLRGKVFSKANRSKLYKNIIEDLLRNDTTGEAVISQGGRSKESYNKMLEQGNKTGYMWILRNLRNIMQTGADLETAIARITDEKAILNSRQHTYRFYSAYKMIEAEHHQNGQEVMDALGQAMEVSCGNLPQLGGHTAVMVDASGSMGSTLSRESIIQCKDISALLGAVSHYISDKSTVIPYSSEAVHVQLSKNDSIITNMDKISNACYGGATNTWLTIQYLFDNKIKVDRIINFTDMQGYGIENIDDILNRYRKEINPDVWFYSVNLVGYGTCEINCRHPRNVELAGWSPQILNFISAMEGDMVKQVDIISHVTP